MKSLWQRILSTIEIDARGLGLFRVILGLILTLKFWAAVPMNFQQVYSPLEGMLGNCFAENYLSAYGAGSMLFHVRTDGALWAFAMGTGLVMCLFMLGFYPRLMALAGSLLLWWWSDRFQMLWFGWEQYAQVLLMLSMLLPVGKRFSLFRDPNSDAQNHLAGPLVFVMLFQVAFIYFFNGLSKNGDKWMDGTAVQFALGGLERQHALGAWLLKQDLLGQLVTYSTLAWELLMLPLMFWPWRHRTVRLLLAISVPAFHFGLSLFMDVGDFKYVSLAACALLLPAHVWDRPPARIQQWGQKGIRLPHLRINTPHALKLATASLLVWVIVGSNLKMSFRSKSEDRLKDWLGGGTLQEFVVTMLPDGLPRYSFFSQHWHLFSPNPPSEQGYVRLEITHLDGRTVPVFAGEEGVERLPTKTQRFLMQYLSYDRENKKAEVFASCLSSREANLWHDAHKGMKAKNLTLALYTWRPKTLPELKAGPAGQIKRVELIRMGFDY